MENAKPQKVTYILGALLIAFSIRSFLIINDLSTGIMFLILGTAILYHYETNSENNK